jgi:hypothetical protein
MTEKEMRIVGRRATRARERRLNLGEGYAQKSLLGAARDF